MNKTLEKRRNELRREDVDEGLKDSHPIVGVVMSTYFDHGYTAAVKEFEGLVSKVKILMSVTLADARIDEDDEVLKELAKLGYGESE